MAENQIRYGIDRCPATKNFSQALHCRYCDFKKKENTLNDCCECLYQKFSKTRADKIDYPTEKIH